MMINHYLAILLVTLLGCQLRRIQNQRFPKSHRAKDRQRWRCRLEGGEGTPRVVGTNPLPTWPCLSTTYPSHERWFPPFKYPFFQAPSIFQPESCTKRTGGGGNVVVVVEVQVWVMVELASRQSGGHIFHGKNRHRGSQSWCKCTQEFWWSISWISPWKIVQCLDWIISWFLTAMKKTLNDIPLLYYTGITFWSDRHPNCAWNKAYSLYKTGY